MRTNRTNSIPLAGSPSGAPARARVEARPSRRGPGAAAGAPHGRPLAAGAARECAASARTSHAGEQVAQPTRGPVAAKRAARARAEQNLMKYAQDNRFVRWFYALTTGPARLAFYLVVAALIGVGIYLPVRDLYVAHRTEDILAQQVAIRERYNKRLDSEVDGYLSQEGIEDAARKDLGMVMPGEKTITVEGLDEDGNPVVKEPEAEGTAAGASGEGASNGGDGAAAGNAAEPDGDGAANGTGADAVGAAGSGPAAGGSSDSKDNGKLKGADAADKSKTGGDTKAAASGKEPTTSAEVEAAERAVYENSEWYWKMLDALFFFDGEGGMAVVSTGEAS